MRKGLWLASALILFVSGMASAGDMKMDAKLSAKNTERLRGFYRDVMSAHNLEAISQYCTDDFVDHNPDPGQKQGMEGLKAAFKAMFTAFPDLKVQVLKTVAEGDIAVAHITVTGTQKGEYMGMPASGKKFKMGGIDMVKINKDGKATDRWGYVDAIAMMQQLSPAKDNKTKK